MASLGELPPELVIQIAACSSTSSLVALEQLCRSWNDLIRDADITCWRHRASSLAAEGSKVGLDDYINAVRDNSVNKTYWQGVDSWKEVCARQAALRRNWSQASTPRTRTDVVGFRRVDPHRSALPVPRLRSLTSSRMLHVPYAAQDSSYVWRARLDTERDANFVLTTWHTGGLRVVDADPAGEGRVLWELPKWSVHPYAHLEYSAGVACWDGDDGIEVWKRWKLVLGVRGEDEPPNKRGMFVKVATLPAVPNTRGFMLNDELHLTVCSSDGQSHTFDLAPSSPELLYRYDIAMTPNNGPAGHIEHDHDVAIYSMGQKGYVVYEKRSATLLGSIDFSQRNSTLYSTLEECKHTNFFTIDSHRRYDELAADAEGAGPRREYVSVSLEQGFLDERGSGQDTIDVHDAFLRAMSGQAPLAEEKRTNGIPLHYDLWGAAMIRKLDDGATILVARSRGGRVLICTDLLGLLATLQGSGEEEGRAKVRECVAIVECGGRAGRTEVSRRARSKSQLVTSLTCMHLQFYTGGWLAVHHGRAAWEIDDLVYMCVLPRRRNSLPRVQTPVWMLASHYSDEVPMPDMQIP